MRWKIGEVSHLVIHKVTHTGWKRFALYGGGGLIVAVILLQVLWPADYMLPWTTIDGKDVSGKTKAAVIDELNAAYAKITTWKLSGAL